MTNVELVARKLAIIDEHVRRLRERRPGDLETLRKDTVLQDALAMGILVVVQECTDIALHIASDEGWELAATYRDAFVVLAKHDVIPDDLAAQLGGAVQLRNRIAHGYASVDVERVWTDLPAGLAAFGHFSQAISRLLPVH